MSIDITEINYGINSDPSGFIHQADSHYHTRLREIACDIAETALSVLLFFFRDLRAQARPLLLL